MRRFVPSLGCVGLFLVTGCGPIHLLGTYYQGSAPENVLLETNDGLAKRSQDLFGLDSRGSVDSGEDAVPGSGD